MQALQTHIHILEATGAQVDPEPWLMALADTARSAAPFEARRDVYLGTEPRSQDCVVAALYLLNGSASFNDLFMFSQEYHERLDLDGYYPAVLIAVAQCCQDSKQLRIVEMIAFGNEALIAQLQRCCTDYPHGGKNPC